MRKKTVLLILLSMLLCGCGADVQPFAAADAVELVSAGAFPGSDMAELDGEILLMLYGIEEETVIECAGFVAANTSISADEAAVFVLKDEAAAVTAEAACRKRVEAQLAMSSWANYLNFLTHRIRIMIGLISQGFWVSIS